MSNPEQSGPPARSLIDALKTQSPALILILCVIGYLYYEGVQARSERAQIRDEVTQLIDKCVVNK
jgi:hypothetical protein